MNEEFGVLKDMIPACTGEMHKLAILQVGTTSHSQIQLLTESQASIDYVRYLEDCVSKLKAENNRTASSTTDKFALPPQAPRPHHYDEDNDIEMCGSEAGISPTYTPIARSARPSASPALLPQDSRHRQDSYSSVSTDRRHYSFSTSATTSPALGPGAYEYARSTPSALTSPALAPQRDLDQEATAALLMLNTDRRNTSQRGGMSVKDLLST